MNKTKIKGEMSILKISALIFIPTAVLTGLYILIGLLQTAIPSTALFVLLAVLGLFPFQMMVVFKTSKKETGKFSLQSAFHSYNKMKWWKIFLYGFLLFGFAGLMSITITPLEDLIFAPLVSKITQIMPEYFDWANIEYLKQYSNGVLIVTCIGYFLCNVFIGPIVEELFFRGCLTSKVNRFGNFAPLIITVFFSLYHFWLPFNNLFRIFAFFPASWIAWKKKNIYIAIVFHCLCNLLSTVGFIIAVFS